MIYVNVLISIYFTSCPVFVLNIGVSEGLHRSQDIIIGFERVFSFFFF